MIHDRRSGQRHAIKGAIVFYRQEQEPAERERLGILENIGSGGLFLATGESLAGEAVLLMRIYNQEAPLGQAEMTVRGIVQRRSEDPKGVGIRFLDPRALGDGGLQGLLRSLSPSLHPVPA